MDIIKYNAPSSEEFIWKFPSDNISFGSQLIVNESQEAIFVKGGKVYDHFGPGTYTISTRNLPILTSIISLPFGGKSPFAAEIWFVNKATKRNLLWGTKERIFVEDPRYNLLVGLSAYGNWGFRIDAPVCFLTKIVGTMTKFDSQQIKNFFLAEIMQKFASVIARMIIQDKVPFSEIVLKYNEISSETIDAAEIELGRFGLSIVNFNIEGLTTGADEIKMIQQVQAKIFEMEKFSKVELTENGKTMKSLDILNNAVTLKGSLAGDIAAAGAGLGLALDGFKKAGGRLGEALSSNSSKSNAEARLVEIRALLEKGLLSPAEFEQKRKEIIDGI